MEPSHNIRVHFSGVQHLFSRLVRGCPHTQREGEKDKIITTTTPTTAFNNDNIRSAPLRSAPPLDDKRRDDNDEQSGRTQRVSVRFGSWMILHVLWYEPSFSCVNPPSLGLCVYPFPSSHAHTHFLHLYMLCNAMTKSNPHLPYV